MNESGPIKKTLKDRENGSEFGDFVNMGKSVWRASLDGKYWILKTAGDDSSSSAAYLRREYELSCKLQHPFILNAIRFEENSIKGAAIVMEYIEGRTLREYLSENPSTAAKRKILEQIMEAVEYLHRNGLLHNDLKPENIMISAIGNDVKIIDFGLSETDADFLNRRLGGTRGSSAPEVLEGDTETLSKGSSDIYSMGVLIDLIFPGRYPFIVHKCLKKDPDKRFQDISSLRNALKASNRRPVVILILIVICSLAAAVILPDILRRSEARWEEETQASKTRQIQEDMSTFFNQAADSINDRSLIPYQEFALLTRNNFVNRTVEYRNTLEQNMLPVCDSIYSRMLVELNQMMTDIPRFEELSSKGLISEKEEKWYFNLFMEGKTFSLYKE